ncbi:MAG: hypothetical protein N2D54_01370 [Chloroflexota bacterium]
MTKNKKDVPKKKIANYQALIDTHTEIEMKGKNMLYTSVNGHMFSILDKFDNVGLRLPKEVREKFMIDHDTKLHESYGSIMREYVRVPEDLLVDTATLAPYLVISYDYVKTLKPKPTTKKKKS